MTTFRENLVLSQISYNDFKESRSGKPLAIGTLLDNPRSSLNGYLNEGDNSAWREPLESMRDWKLINYQPNTSSGFSGAAFQNSKGEIVIVFRGTEAELSLNFIRDGWTDGKIAATLNSKLIGQFSDAEKFICQTMGVKSIKDLPPDSKLSFAGHSLGGGLAQYAAYLTRDKGTVATTFNAVGVGQCLPGVKSPEKFPRIKNYCDAWDLIGNYGVALGERIYTINDQQLDGPVYMGTHSSMEYACNPLLYLEDQWNYAGYKFNESMDRIADAFKKNINTHLFGTLYSHGLSGFINDCDQNGQFIESHRVPESEVKFVQAITKGIQLEKAGLKKVGTTVNEVIDRFIRNKKETPQRQAQARPNHQRDGSPWPKYLDQPPKDFVAIAKNMKQETLAKSLGYSGYDQLVKDSRVCAEKDGVKFYISEVRNGKMALWDDRSMQKILEFPDRKTWEAFEKECLANVLQQQTIKARDQQMERKSSGMGMR